MPPKIDDKSKMTEDIMGCFIAMCMRNNASFIAELRVLYNGWTDQNLTYDAMKGRLRHYNAIGRKILEKAEKNGGFEGDAGKSTTKGKRKASGDGEGDSSAKKKKVTPKTEKKAPEKDVDDDGEPEVLQTVEA